MSCIHVSEKLHAHHGLSLIPVSATVAAADGQNPA